MARRSNGMARNIMRIALRIAALGSGKRRRLKHGAAARQARNDMAPSK